jgi:hypothetical protein
LDSSGIATYSTGSLDAGSYSVTAAYVGDTNYLPATSSALAVSVVCPMPGVGIFTTTPRMLVGNPVILVATVASPVAAPTGQVRFMDGTGLLAQVALTNGEAVFSTSALDVGVHSVQAIYEGDAHFESAASSALAVTVLDFRFTSPGGSQTVGAGGTASYLVNINPTSGAALPLPANLAVTGLPPGAIATVSPSSWVAGPGNTWTLAANTTLPQIALSISTQSISAQLRDADRPAPRWRLLGWSVLLLPLLGRLRRARKRFAGRIYLLFLSAVGAMLLVGNSGCGGGFGFLNRQPQTYAITVTLSSGNLVHSTTLTLVVE